MVKLGVALPNCGDRIDPADLVRLAVGAERIGLDSVWVADRWLRPHNPVLVPGVPVPIEMPAEHYRTVFDPLEVLTFVAAHTRRILLGTSAVNVLYHPPVLLARRLATLDQLSGGRLIAGVTMGWMKEEFAVAGVSDQRTGERFEDHLAAMRQVWSPDPVSYQGRHYKIPESDIGPKPYQPGGVPLVVGYATPAGTRRAARIGGGLHPYRSTLAALEADLDLWHGAVAEAGHDPARKSVILRAAATLDGEVGLHEKERALFNGDLNGYTEDLRRVAELGVDHVFLQFRSSVGVDATLDIMTNLVAETGR